MRLHRNCVTDPIAKEMWRDYQHVISEGNPLGLSFTEYVAARVLAQRSVAVTSAATTSVEYLPAQCGHRHPWGQSCSAWSDA